MEAQGVKNQLTSLDKLMMNPEQRLYLYQSDTCRGILKMGVKVLYLLTPAKVLKDFSPLSVLDFYVDQPAQRRGFGLFLFEHMLRHESPGSRIDPGSLAYDRPSPKLVAFLARHYGLTPPLEQANRFVIFDEFFSKAPSRVPDGAPRDPGSTAVCGAPAPGGEPG